MLSIAYAGSGQHQDAGGKVIHLASETTSQIISKSISKGGGRTSYRGLVQVEKGAENVKSKVVCDALLLDEESRSDTYPDMRINEKDVSIEHEATVKEWRRTDVLPRKPGTYERTGAIYDCQWIY